MSLWLQGILGLWSIIHETKAYQDSDQSFPKLGHIKIPINHLQDIGMSVLRLIIRKTWTYQDTINQLQDFGHIKTDWSITWVCHRVLVRYIIHLFCLAVQAAFLLDNIYIRFGSKLYRQIVGIPMGTNCAPLVADLFLFCYERDFMLSLSEENQSGIIEAFNSTSRYLDDLLNIDNNFFDSMVNRIYPSELQLNKANVSDAEA